MKIYVHEKGVVLVGKAWEIREKLKEYDKDFRLVKDWVEFKKTRS
ncbi:Z-ring formation inhibitor MciZ [Cytobacillus depressus]|uniref:Z-ring formation inhibitor MciZ n=1 Tax=Cytobacillus depressus TaxID=1602942 RepID=A0A6L3VGN8_9BACI|nr:Z-ring formation inhibitor MciZ [Cytobacillus depressus]KAB2338395.1 Z-ring formation inhibitor MciZ [Cytobacillus depressus]